MAIVIESVATQSYTSPTGNDLTITKPTGLSVGDLMVSCLAHHGNISNIGMNWATPSGWSLVNESRLNLALGDGFATAVFYKVADSSDVSASDFTFSLTSAQEYVGGCILRVSGIRSDTQFGDGDIDTESDTDNPSYIVALAPAQDNILYIAMFASGSVIYTSTDVTINGTNPTWTRQFSTAVTVDTPSQLEVFTAVDTSHETSITTLTPTETGSSAITDSQGYLSFFLGKTDVTGTLDFIEETDTAFNISGNAGVKGTLDFIEETDDTFDIDGKVKQPTRWTNETKPTTVWTNEDRL